MIVFLDASAMVALMTGETGFFEIERRFGEADEGLCSALSLWETTLAIARQRTVPLALARDEVQSFITDFALRLVPIGKAETDAALVARDRYGKGRHPAKLNMGDCFAYACAKTNGATLLYKGDDFARTDVADA